MDFGEENSVFIPEDILEEAKVAAFNTLPPKSKEKYEHEYKIFDNWRNLRNIKGLNEDVLLAYFLHLSKSLQSSSMWCKYSKLKATIKIFEDIDISRFTKLTAFLKGKSRDYKPKKARILERENIVRFLVDAPDSQYLLMKIALIIAISGACRCDELTKLTTADIEDKGAYLYIKIPDSKTNKPRSFAVIEEGFPVNPLQLYKKYVSLRPKNPNSSDYTGHCFRRSSATLLADGGADIMEIKRHGAWKNNNVAEGYIEDSIKNKIEIARKISGAKTSTVVRTPVHIPATDVIASTSATESAPATISVPPPPPPINIYFSSRPTSTINVTVNNALTKAFEGQFGGIHFHGPIQNINIYKKETE